MVFTMPEFLERRFSPASRYVLSVVSMITFIVTKIAVGIFAGGVVFLTLLPATHLTIAGSDVGPFWIGSVLVVVMTGLYTMLGGMRAVAYNDANLGDRPHRRLGLAQDESIDVVVQRRARHGLGCARVDDHDARADSNFPTAAFAQVGKGPWRPP